MDANRRTPLALAVPACVDSYWLKRRAPDSVRPLLAAGESTSGIAAPAAVRKWMLAAGRVSSRAYTKGGQEISLLLLLERVALWMDLLEEVRVDVHQPLVTAALLGR